MISHCDDVRGMLPWLLNGSLEEDEKQQVLQHLATCEACRREWAETRLVAGMFDQHLPAAAIVALAWDETPEDIDPELLEEHLAGCPRCAAELELARTSRRLAEDEKIVPLTRPATPAPAPAAPGWRGWKAAALAAALAGVVASGGWFQTAGRIQTLEEQLAARSAAPSPLPGPAAAGGSAASGEDSTRARQLAAELDEKGKTIEQLQTQLSRVEQQAAALSGQVDQLAQAQPRGPQVVSRPFELTPSQDVVRGREPGVEIPAREAAVLVLTANHPETHRDHAIEIVDAAGKVAWRAAGLPRDDVYGYTLSLPPGALPAGTYTIRVYGMAEGRREPVETYPIQIR